MAAWIIWILLIVAAYLLGSVPVSYLVAKARGIDLRQQGTAQVGGGNLWRMTSWKCGLPVIAFDFAKGMFMVWAAYALELNVAQQVIVGLAVIAGHNWPVFLCFHGGRGIFTTMGIVIILPLLNSVTIWPLVIGIGIAVVGTILIHSSPLPVFIGIVSMPVTNGIFGAEPIVTQGYLAILLIIILKRLAAESSSTTLKVSKSQLLFNRLLFDRDIRDRQLWMYRKPALKKKARGGRA